MGRYANEYLFRISSLKPSRIMLIPNGTQPPYIGYHKSYYCLLLSRSIDKLKGSTVTRGDVHLCKTT